MTTTAAAEPTSISVVGLGEMGSAVALAFVHGAHPTTVWNRTPEKADALVAEGARKATSIGDAVAASSLLVVSVKGNPVIREILEPATDALEGRSVLNLTDGTSSEARDAAAWLTDHGAECLHGQIMTIAPALGAPDSVVFYGGSEALYHRIRPTLQLLGGSGAWISADVGIPTLYGMAVNDTMWGALNGFLHAAALLSSEGIDVAQFLRDADPAVSALLASFPMLAAEIDRGEYAIPYGALQHHLPSAADLVRESRARGIDTELPRYTLDLVTDALDAGHAADSYARLVEHFRKP